MGKGFISLKGVDCKIILYMYMQGVDVDYLNFFSSVQHLQLYLLSTAFQPKQSKYT